MGQHKHNPTAIAAKKGEIPPKKKLPSMNDKELAKIVAEYFAQKTPLGGFFSIPPKYF